MSNYEKMKYQVRADFLRYNQQEMIKKIPVKYDQDYFYITFFGRSYRICRKIGEVLWSKDDFNTSYEADYNEVMTLYDVLCYSKPGCYARGEFVNLKSMSAIQAASATTLGIGLFHNHEMAFEHKVNELAAACEALGGEPYGKGDVAYRIPMFDFMSVVIQFWDSDEEFGPSLQIFLDKNILDFMHYETTWYALGHLLNRLMEEMDGFIIRR